MSALALVLESDDWWGQVLDPALAQGLVLESLPVLLVGELDQAWEQVLELE